MRRGSCPAGGRWDGLRLRLDGQRLHGGIGLQIHGDDPVSKSDSRSRSAIDCRIDGNVLSGTCSGLHDIRPPRTGRIAGTWHDPAALPTPR